VKGERSSILINEALLEVVRSARSGCSHPSYGVSITLR
jgi:hypothetical protein